MERKEFMENLMKVLEFEMKQIEKDMAAAAENLRK